MKRTLAMYVFRSLLYLLRHFGVAALVLAGLAISMLPTSPAAAATALEIATTQESANSMDGARVHDDDRTTGWRTRGNDAPNQAWITFDLGQVANVDSVRWLFNAAGHADRMTIKRSTDNKTWVRVGTTKRSPKNKWISRQIGAELRFLRFSFSNPNDDRYIGSLGEVDFFGQAGDNLSGDDGSGALCQRIAVPAYFDPETHWEQAISDAPATDIMILNPNSGVDIKFSQGWADTTKWAQGANITVIGYVITFLGERPIAEVKDEIDLYYEWYGVDGIYIDNAADQEEDIPYYRELANYTRGHDENALVALNPGWSPHRGFMDFIDIVETYEYEYDTYLRQEFPAWTLDYPADRFMHVVHSVPNAEAAVETINLAKERNAGYIFITHVENPDIIYKSLGDYWDLQVNRSCA